MIYPVEMFSADCDVCNDDFETPFEGYSALADKSTLIESITDNGWHVGDGEEGEKDKTYCPNCWTRGENDKFTLIPKTK